MLNLGEKDVFLLDKELKNLKGAVSTAASVKREAKEDRK